MRKIKIEKNIESNCRYFVDVHHRTNIMCAFEEKRCSPDCASCKIYDSFFKAVCQRADEGIDIGVLETKH